MRTVTVGLMSLLFLGGGLLILAAGATAEGICVALFGLIGVVASPLLRAQRRGHSAAGDSSVPGGALATASGGYLALALLATSLSVGLGVAMMILGPARRFDQSGWSARIIGAGLAVVAGWGVVVGLRHWRRTR